MTSQLDEQPAQILPSTPERNESPSRRWTWIVATAAVAGLAIGAGLIVAMARTDRAGSPVGNAEQGDAPAPRVNGSDLPLHLQEFELRTTAGPSEGPDAAEYARMQRLARDDSLDAAEYARMQRLAAVAAQAAEEPQRSAYQIIQDEIDASLARRDSASGD